MFCTNCGKEVNSKFCSNCGTKVIENEDTLQNNNNEDSTVDTTTKKGFWASVIEQGNAINQQKALEKKELKERIKQYDKDGTPYCPKCYSTSLSANKKGFGIGKAVIGTALTMNPLGLVAGNLGAKKVRVTCLKCGNQFMAGK